MANTPISGFGDGSPAQSGDEYVIARGGANYKLTGANIKTLVIGAGSVSIASGKTFTSSNTLTLAGTDGSTLNVGTGGTLGALATVSAGTGVATAAGNAVNGSGGFITYATFSPASGKTLTLNNSLTLAGTDGTTMTFPSASGTVATLNAANVFTKANTFQPDSDAQAGTFRRNSSGQTANVVEIQTEANAFLAAFDKTGALTIGAASGNTGALKLKGTTSGTVTLSTADAAGTWTMKLPTGVPAGNGYLLSSNTSGDTSWVAPPSATLTVGSTATSGGAAGQLMFDTGSVLSESSSLVWDNTNKLLTATGLGTGGGANTGGITVSGGALTLSGNISANAWTTSGIRYKSVAATLTDLTSTGTVATAYTNVYGGNTIAASNAGVVFSDYYTTYINPPSSGSNVTFTRSWALGIGGNLQIGANAAAGTDVAASSVNICAPRGRGTGAGGSLVFQVAPAGTTGSSLNAPATALTIDSTKLATFAGNINMPSTFSIQANGTSQADYGVTTSGMWTFANSTSASQIIVRTSSSYGMSLNGNYPGFGMNSLFNGSNWAAIATGFSGLFQLDVTTGNIAFVTATSASAGANINSILSTRLIITNGGMVVVGAAASSSHPALKKSGTTLQVRLADDSAFAPLACGNTTASATALDVSGTGAASLFSVTNTTTGTLLDVVNSSAVSLFSVNDTNGATVSTVPLVITGNQSISSFGGAAISNLSGVKIKGGGSTLTDTGTAGSGTVALGATNVLGGNTLAATNSSVTYTDYFSNFYKDPVAGTNITLTRKYSLGTEGAIRVNTGTSIPAGGSAATGVMLSSTAGFGVFFGSGAPTVSAAKGSLYLRSDGSGTSDRMYVNTDGGTTWTAVTTAA